MTLKTNQEKATEDTHRRIKKKVKKAKKRIKKNATMTPQVARNTRADAAKYPAYTPFAYRPADSPTHILKSKNDLVKITNAFRRMNWRQIYQGFNISATWQSNVNKNLKQPSVNA